MPRPIDALLQSILLVVLIMVATTFSFESKWLQSLWFILLAAVWFGFNELLRSILSRRAAAAESNCEELPEGVYSALSRQCLPEHWDVLLAVLVVVILSDEYSPELFSFLPTRVSQHAWIVVLVAFYMLTYLLFYLPILRQRVRNTYYRCMYEHLKAE